MVPENRLIGFVMHYCHFALSSAERCI